MPRLILNYSENDLKMRLIREVFTSLRHSTVFYLLKEPKNPTALANEMGISRTAVTLTLNKFLELNVIEKKKAGKKTFYRINQENMCHLIRDLIKSNIKERTSAINENIDVAKIDKLFEREDFKELMKICCKKVAEDKKYPIIRIIDDFLNTLHVFYVNAALNKKIGSLDARESLIKMDRELKHGLDELMKVYITYPAKNYKENLEWFRKVA
jgi:predicted transcriptional regulator